MTPSDPKPGKDAGPPADPDRAAAYWVSRQRLGLMGAGDEVAFAAWLTDPLHAAAYDTVQDTVHDMGAIAADPEVRRMREAALAARPLRTRRFTGGGWPAAAAVGAVAVLAIGVWIGRMPSPAPHVPAAAPIVATADQPIPAVKRYTTQVGERLDVQLDDGSKIALNTASVLTVQYSAAHREVRLLQGQALFQVAKDPQRPFVVTAGDRRITAVGTAFDVRVDDGRMKVVLVEGRVNVDPLQQAGLGRLIPALNRQALEPGQQLVTAVGEPPSVTIADIERDTSWRRGQVIFRNDTVAAALAEMNRYSEIQLVVEDPRVAGLRISGVFGVSRPDNFLAALRAYYPLETQQRSPKVMALVWREGRAPASRDPD